MSETRHQMPDSLSVVAKSLIEEPDFIHAPESFNMKKNILIAGSTGLIGNFLLKYLLEEEKVEKVYALTRRDLGFQHQKLVQIIFDFDKEESYKSLPAVDEIMCCLGTTIKVAGSKENFRKVDQGYPLKLAKWGKSTGVSAYHVITSMGTSENSRIFYSRVKGELEEALKKINFERLFIYQPSQLLGDRKEHRRGEKIAIAVMKFIDPIVPAKYKIIKVQDVAKAMKVKLLGTEMGARTFLSDEIQRIADEDQS